MGQRHEHLVVAALEEVVPLSHPALQGRLGVAVRGYACAQEGAPAMLCHAVGFGKTACALALAAVRLAAEGHRTPEADFLRLAHRPTFMEA